MTDTVYTETTVPTSASLSGLFPDIGAPIDNPTAVAMAIRWAIVHHNPTDLKDLSGHLGITEDQLEHSMWALEVQHRIRDVGRAGVFAKIDAINEYKARHGAVEERKRVEAELATQTDERGFYKRPEVVSRFTWMPVDVDHMVDPHVVGNNLMTCIERSKATGWGDLADKLGVEDLDKLIKLCRALWAVHGFEKLSSKCLNDFFTHWASQPVTPTPTAQSTSGEPSMNQGAN